MDWYKEARKLDQCALEDFEQLATRALDEGDQELHEHYAGMFHRQAMFMKRTYGEDPRDELV